MKMQKLQNKSQSPQLEAEAMQLQLDNERAEKMEPGARLNPRCLDSHREHLFKLRREKENLTKELAELKKRERQFGLQRRNLHDAIQRVNWLERELSIKEEQLVDCQSREKEVKAQTREVQISLENARAARTENMKLSNLIPSLIDWLQSLKKIQAVKCDQRHIFQVQQYEASLANILDECLPSKGSESQSKHDQAPTSVQSEPQSENNPTTFVETRKEVQELQRELEKLACFK